MIISWYFGIGKVNERRAQIKTNEKIQIHSTFKMFNSALLTLDPLSTFWLDKPHRSYLFIVPTTYFLACIFNSHNSGDTSCQFIAATAFDETIGKHFATRRSGCPLAWSRSALYHPPTRNQTVVDRRTTIHITRANTLSMLFWWFPRSSSHSVLIPDSFQDIWCGETSWKWNLSWLREWKWRA